VEELIYIELLERHGAVASRHPARAFPVRIGRAYDNDVILDDPYAAPHHAVLQRAPTGELEIADAGSRNGLFRCGARRRIARERVDPSARYRAGRTEFRVRPASHPVGAELPYGRMRWLRQPLLALAALLAVVGVVLLGLWSGSGERIRTDKLVSLAVFTVAALFVWAGAWGFAGRLLSGERRVAAHLAVAALALIGMLAANRLDYAAFALSAARVDFLVLFAIGAALAWGFWRHLALVVRHSTWGTALAAAAVAAACVGLTVIPVRFDVDQELTEMAYMKTIKLPAARLVEGTGTAQFLQDAERIKDELEALKQK